MRRKRRTWIVVAVLVTPIIVAFGLGPAAAGSTATSAPLQLESALAPGEVAQASGQVAEAAIQSEVTLTQSCSPLTILLGALSRCEIQVANNSFEEQVVDLDTYADREFNIVGSEGGAEIIDRHHARLHNVTLAGAQPGGAAVDPGSGPAGYLPLDLFGVTPDPIGDEDFINYNVPAFVYAGQTWTVLGVNSNGYIVVGGGAPEDNECCALPPGADPARPNNVLAPFWTDLDGTGAPGIFAAVLTDGVNSWIVVESRLNVFGTASLRVFQTWIGINGVEDITYAYDPANLPADPFGFPFLVGAENSAGQGEMNATLPTEDLRVTTSDPIPGGTATYAVHVRGKKPGLGKVRTELVAPTGTSLATTQIEVKLP